MDMDMLLENVTTTTISPGGTGPPWAGYLGVVIAIIFFGSNFVPAAKYPIRDGVSFQFFLCCGIWTTGVVVNLIVGSPPFFPLVIVGGVLWTTGNCLSMFVIPINGLGVSMLLWCTSNLFMGWASGRFGWFGLKPQPVDHSVLNYLGVAIAVLSGLIFLAIKSEQVDDKDIENRAIIDADESPIINSLNDNFSEKKSSPEKVSFKMRIIGYILAIISGCFFGLVFTASQYIQDHPEKYPGSTKNGLHYIYSMFTGILLSSFVYYSIYILAKKNRPYIVVESIFPAFVSGIMWGIAQNGFIVANSILSQAISYPLISIGPGTLAALWSILYIKDIRGMRNYLIFALGTLVRVIAGVFIVLSKL